MTGQQQVAISTRRAGGFSPRGFRSAGMVLAATLTLGATATFTPVGPTTVYPGTDVTFTVSVSVEVLSGFDSADIVIGSNDATDIAFVYSTAWMNAFDNVTAPTPLGLYAQDVFVGGNNPTPVGSAISLGGVTVATDDMTEGTYDIRIDPGVFGPISSLTLGGVRDYLQGTAAFEIKCAAADPQCDYDVDLFDYRLMWACITGPGTTPSAECSRYDGDGDGDVDVVDLSAFFVQFTGPF